MYGKDNGIGDVNFRLKVLYSARCAKATTWDAQRLLCCGAAAFHTISQFP